MPVKYGEVIAIQYEASYEDGTTFDGCWQRKIDLKHPVKAC